MDNVKWDVSPLPCCFHQLTDPRALSVGDIHSAFISPHVLQDAAVVKTEKLIHTFLLNKRVTCTRPFMLPYIK